MTPPTLSDASAVYDHVLAESGSRDAALWAALRMFSVSRKGKLERTAPSVVVAAGCAFFHVELAELLGGARPARLARPRMAIMAVLRAAGETYQDAGAAVGKGKSDAIHAVKRVEADQVLALSARELAAFVAELVGRPEELVPVVFPARVKGAI